MRKAEYHCKHHSHFKRSRLWVLVRSAAVLGVLVWLRRKLPMFRPDRFMEIGWTVLLPAVVVQDLVVSLVVVWKG